ncbi:hypothetical protein, partial [Blattabacterium cuenoti]|uniref:hypothetical protein n=1 Tax=Blattabacterium cuenoti TaxID=1653831 RepID=UPI00163C549C
MKIKIILFLLSIFLLIACDDEEDILCDIDGPNNMVNIYNYKKYAYHFHKKKMYYQDIRNVKNMRNYHTNPLLSWKKNTEYKKKVIINTNTDDKNISTKDIANATNKNIITNTDQKVSITDIANKEVLIN